MTGDPRNDHVLGPSERLPADLREQEERLQALVGDRRLVLVEPTYRGGDEAYRRFDQPELDWLSGWCARQDVVLGFRDHPSDRARQLTQVLWSLGALNLTRNRFPSLEVVDRVAAGLVTDLSARAVEFAATGKPMVVFDERSDRPGDLVHDVHAVLRRPWRTTSRRSPVRWSGCSTPPATTCGSPAGGCSSSTSTT